MGISVGGITANTGIPYIFIEKLTPAAVANITSSAEPAYDEYLIIFRDILLSGNNNLYLQFNADAGAHYTEMHTSVNAVASNTAQSNMVVLNAGANFATSPFNAWLRIRGKSPAIASGQITVDNQGAGGSSGLYFFICGNWTAGNATQLSTILVGASAGTFSGTIEIWGRSFHS